MKNFLSILLFLVSSIAFGADNLIGSGSQWQLVDNAGARWNAAVAYTTNGSGDVYTLGGLSAAGDNYYGDNVSGNHLLLANDGKKWALNVFYTTDGSGNVVPITGGGGGGAAWGAITGTLSSQTDLQTALNAKQSTLVPGHDLWIDRNGSDSANCSLAAPCQTVGHAITLVTSPSSTNNWTIHLLSGRHDQETDDLLLPVYTWIVGNGGPDVGSYLRLPAGKAIKIDSSWTVNGRGGIQSVYLGGGTSINLDYAGLGGSAGSNFMLDDVFVTGSFNHTGRGINGGDFLYIQNSFIFGSATLVGDQVQSNSSAYAGSFTAGPSSTVPSDLSMFGGSIAGAVSLSQSGSQHLNYQSSGVVYTGGFTTTGTVGLTADLNLPIGYTLSGGTTRTNTSSSASIPYIPGVSGNWSPAPTQVSTALDQLAVRVPVAGAVASVTGTAPIVSSGGLNPAISISSFGGDSGTGGIAGAVPAPAAISAEQGLMLGAGGAFTANDTQKPNNAPFRLITQAPSVSGNQKMLNALIVQNGANTYAIAAGGTTKTVTIYNVTDQAQPQLRGSINLAGSYGACGSNASWPYVYIPASGGRTLTVLNISNPNNPVVTGTYSWAANTTSIYGCAYYNGLVFMAGQSRGLGILDVGNGVSGGTPALPVLAFDEGGTAECSVANSCKSFGVAVDGANSIAYVTTFSTATPWTYRELKAYSFASSITAPTLLQDLPMPANTKALGVTLNLGTHTAFVTDSNQTLIDVVDITNVSTGGMSNLSTIAPTGGRTFNSELAAIAVSGSNYVYIPAGGNAVQGGIDMYDLTNRSAPKWVAAVLDPLANNVFGSGAVDPRGGYIYIGSYGTGTAGSALDIFSMPFEKSAVGVESVSQLAIKNIFQLPVQASGITPTCAAAADSGKLALTNAFILCVCNGATPAWVTASTGTVACTF